MIVLALAVGVAAIYGLGMGAGWYVRGAYVRRRCPRCGSDPQSAGEGVARGDGMR